MWNAPRESRAERLSPKPPRSTPASSLIPYRLARAVISHAHTTLRPLGMLLNLFRNEPTAAPSHDKKHQGWLACSCFYFLLACIILSFFPSLFFLSSFFALVLSVFLVLSPYICKCCCKIWEVLVHKCYGSNLCILAGSDADETHMRAQCGTTWHNMLFTWSNLVMSKGRKKTLPIVQLWC